jgi:hypothetical protein
MALPYGLSLHPSPHTLKLAVSPQQDSHLAALLKRVPTALHSGTMTTLPPCNICLGPLLLLLEVVVVATHNGTMHLHPKCLQTVPLAPPFLIIHPFLPVPSLAVALTLLLLHPLVALTLPVLCPLVALTILVLHPLTALTLPLPHPSVAALTLLLLHH